MAKRARKRASVGEAPLTKAAEAEPVEVHHHPHPMHNWPEFLREIGVVVIGVLLALSAEQVAEAFHWRHEVEVEREALRSEVRTNLSTAAYRQSEQGCIDARLAQIAEVFRRHARGQALGLKRQVARPPLWVATTGSWDIAVSGQALGHMPQKEKLAFSDAFNSFKSFGRLRGEEDADWRKLALLDRPELLDVNDWSSLHQAWGELVGVSNRLRSVTGEMLGPASLGERPGKNPDEEVALREAFCAPLID
jgi:hypothetical protein